MTTNRSQQPDGRNPLLRLPAALALLAFLQDQPALRRHLAALLHELGTQADQQAEYSWKQRKAPIAAYWRAVAVYARHLARSLSYSFSPTQEVNNGITSHDYHPLF